MTLFKGSCACGTIRYQADASPCQRRHCDCALCRHVIGEAVVLGVDFPASSLHWLGTPPVFYSGAGRLRRGICSNCGSAVCTVGNDDVISVNASTLDEAVGIAPRSHVHARYESWPAETAVAL